VSFEPKVFRTDIAQGGLSVVKYEKN
jgi:hypothetical protein